MGRNRKRKLETGISAGFVFSILFIFAMIKKDGYFYGYENNDLLLNLELIGTAIFLIYLLGELVK